MEREFLERLLAEGRSLEYIGALVSRDPSTVAYWIKKHGLVAAHREAHLARGGVSRSELESHVREGATVREIAARLDVSDSTVRYWLGAYGLRTKAAKRRRERLEAHHAEQELVIVTCKHHGQTEHWLEGRGSYRCLRCRSDAVARRRRNVKATLVAEAGGACARCGYDRCIGALHFHHRDPSTKSFTLSNRGWTRSLAAAREEAGKCVLLCSNCHAEVEAGLARV